MTQTPWLGFSIDRTSPIPIFEQICTAMRAAIAAGELRQGQRLPATRVFATELGLSRSTVVTAYEQLVAEGYLQSVQGSGYTVCALGEVELESTRVNPQDETAETKRLAVPFESGQPDMRLFPYRQWAKAVARVCRTNPEAMLIGGGPFGNFDLRRAIAAHVADWRGIQASGHQVIVTAGSSDALDICLRGLAQNGDTIGIETPGYQPIHHFAQTQGLKSHWLAIDAGGAQLPQSQPTPRVVVLTPSHQYPLGGAMTPSRRQEFIRWADVNNSWIIEDDYDSEFRYAGRPIPAMAGFDQLNRTVYIGSFSKIFSNALRLGYIVAPRDLMDRFRAAIRQTGLRASYMPQQALADFMESGEFYRHLRRVRRVYGERRRYLLDRLAQDFEKFGQFQDHQAGMQVVFHLKGGLRDTTVAARAQNLGVDIEALSECAFVPRGENGLILGFCGYQIQDMSAALDRLKLCFAPD
ncbi:PLP-dependent aminotransferase family protein [uncultured Pelagimonas sp.]|uniref:MocR-like pyridoxine biosynthesis transcription factor PdxR n=1 Tax=uncultured Pelagimonas sp. TaxID=1618102 RepID=UPI0026178F8A|nr:PLP-dependent aminotransferase family protein [uncultured Pelagimonas sp.]